MSDELEMVLTESISKPGTGTRVTAQQVGDDVIVTRYVLVRGEIRKESVRLRRIDMDSLVRWWNVYGKEGE